MNYCPCCSNQLLQHIRGSEIFWFCRHCWQEMPVLSCKHHSSFTELIIGESSTKLQETEQTNAKIPVTKQEVMSEWIGVNKIPILVEG